MSPTHPTQWVRTLGKRLFFYTVQALGVMGVEAALSSSS